VVADAAVICGSVVQRNRTDSDGADGDGRRNTDGSVSLPRGDGYGITWRIVPVLDVESLVKYEARNDPGSRDGRRAE